LQDGNVGLVQDELIALAGREGCDRENDVGAAGADRLSHDLRGFRLLQAREGEREGRNAFTV
jgi:hypothetical protein